MKTPKAAPDEKPENTDKLTPPKQAETDSQAVTRKFKATPAFDLSDDADLDRRPPRGTETTVDPRSE